MASQPTGRLSDVTILDTMGRVDDRERSLSICLPSCPTP